MAKDYIQEYLIGLGFDVDENKMRKFRESAVRATKDVAGLGETAIATTAAIGYMVEQAARQYEDLYYVSQRTGRSVIALKAYEFASRQVGVSAETARGQTEAFYATLRTNPGMQGLLKNLGGDAAGGPGDLVATLKKKFGESGYFVASRFAQMFGIDEQSFRTYWLNVERLAASQADSIKRQREAGVSSQENTAKFREYANSVDHLSDNFGILTTRIAQDWLPTANSVLPWLDGLITRFNKADDASDGLLGRVSSLLVALGAGGIANKVLQKLLGISVGGSFGAFVGKGGGVGGLALEIAEALKEDSQTGNRARTALRSFFGIEDPNEAVPWAPRFRKNVLIGHKYDPEERGSEAKRTTASATMAYFEKQGWSREQAAGIAANLNEESKMNPKAVGDGGAAFGIGQWHPDRQADFKRQFGKDIRQSTLEEQLAFVQFELTQGREQAAAARLRQVRSPEAAGAVVSQYYERPGAVFEAAINRARQSRQLFDANANTMAGGERPEVSAALDRNRQAVLAAQQTARIFNSTLAPAPSTVASSAPIINHDTDINLYGNADQAAQTAIVNAQYDTYAAAVRNNLPRTR